MDTEVSPPYPESWREGISEQTFPEGDKEFTRLRAHPAEYYGGSYTSGHGDSAEVCGK